ncbi:MAG: beta-glucosidase family protein [Promethearchaeota archaeon]
MFKRAIPGGGVNRLGIPTFRFTDGPRGVIIPGSTCFPVSMARAATWDTNLEEQVGNVIGKEVRAQGGNLFGGVCINILRHPAGGRAQETYGEDPFLLGEFGAALVRGVQQHNVMATVKHFAVNDQENARFKINVKLDERTLREVYLPHFRHCVEEGCATIMSAYNKVRGEYCGHNSYILRKILKDEWGFKGFVHSDWFFGLRDTLKGVNGGLDVEMPRAKYYGKKLIKLVRSEIVAMDLIDDAVRRIIRTTLKFTTKEDPEEYDRALIGCKDHVSIAKNVADESMVLLKNESSILPFDAKNLKKLAVIGKLADLKNTGDHGSSNVRQDNIITPLQGIKKLMEPQIDIIYHDGIDIQTTKTIVKEVDAVVIVVGYTNKNEGEYIKILGKTIGGDRDNLGLRSQDIQLINSISEVNDNVVVVLVGGSAIMMEEWKNNVKGIIMAWYSGMEGGRALADILFGNVNPSGKLPFTIPKDPSDLPFFDKNADEIEYGYYHGYTLFEKENIEPAFPFGFGLSYTSYKYDNFQVNSDDNEIISSVDVTNTGSLKGDEIVQLYIGFEDSEIDRPKKILKGFTRVSLGPNETKKVTIKVNKSNLAWYNPESEKWEIENMNYSVYIGGSSKIKDLLKEKISF